MTTIARWRSGRLGHYGAMMQAAASGAAACWSLLTLVVGDDSGFVVALGLLVALFLIVALVGFILNLTHRDHLCARCIDAFPADGQNQAALNAGWLRLSHRRGPGLFVIVAMLIAVFGSGSYSDLIATTGYAMAALAGAADVKHARLRPWCPQCNWGDDGGAPSEPSPVPPSVKAPR